VNVDSERFHEGRGAGKSTTLGGREKNAYFCTKNVSKNAAEMAFSVVALTGKEA
jgi:hypothetical protein